MFRFYRFIRRHSKPVPFHTAEKWDRRLNIAYMFCAWNAICLTIMLIYKSDGKMKSPSLESYVDKLEIPKATLIQIKGLSSYKVTEYVRDTGIDPEDHEKFISSSSHGVKLRD